MQPITVWLSLHDKIVENSFVFASLLGESWKKSEVFIQKSGLQAEWGPGGSHNDCGLMIWRSS